MEKHILVVDDEEMIRMINTRILERSQYKVTTAQDGAEAFDLLTKNSIDAVVTDYGMPGMDGLALIQKARQYGYKGPIVLYCAQPDDVVKKALEAGASAYLKKPLQDILDLPKALAGLLHE